MRDANISNPHGEIVIFDVATASIESVLEVEPYSYLEAVNGVTLRILKVCERTLQKRQRRNAMCV